MTPASSRQTKNSKVGFLRRNGLSIAFLGLTLASLLGHATSGYGAENSDRALTGLPPLELTSYLASGAFLSSLFENWESEFLQMALFVVLTVFLRQRGSSESRPFESEPAVEYSPSRAPWPVRAGGLWLRVYEHSLSIALFTLFAGSFIAHWLASHQHEVEQAAQHGRAVDHGVAAHLTDSQFWFESFQNWQSEFFSITALVLLTIFLREKDSSQSKDVAAPHRRTGDH